MSSRSKSVCLCFVSWISICAADLFFARDAHAGGGEIELAELISMSIEELTTIDITSVSKKRENAYEAAAAVYVLTQEDIQRSGARSVPDALRLVPGIEVAQFGANSWAVSARGFNNAFAQRLLVLIDGRTVYHPVFAGVLWDGFDVLIENIERIEVVRGPGATLWGANAVNGIINIITKSAADAKGTLVLGGAGTEQKTFVAVREGVQLGSDASAYAYFKADRRDPTESWMRGDAYDAWEVAHAGSRLDWSATTRDSVTVQADAYTGRSEKEQLIAALTPPYETTDREKADFKAADVLSRWEHVFSEDSSLELQSYLDYTSHSYPAPLTARTLDVQAHYRFAPFERHDVIAGTGYRYISDDSGEGLVMNWIPGSDSYAVFSAFVQDEISLIERRLDLIVGAKFEHNEFNEPAVQPTIRLVWTPNAQNTAWGAVSRAIHASNRTIEDVYIRNLITYAPEPPEEPLPWAAPTTGNDQVGSEKLTAYELGYRFRPTQQLAFDFAFYYNDYDDVENWIYSDSLTFSAEPVPHGIIPLTAADNGNAESHGLELAANYTPVEWWRLELNYTFFRMNATNLNRGEEGSSPRNKAGLRSLINVSPKWQFDSSLTYVDQLPWHEIGAYVELNARLAWKARPWLQLSLVGANLLEEDHEEFLAIPETGSPLGFVPSKVERGIYGMATVTF